MIYRHGKHGIRIAESAFMKNLLICSFNQNLHDSLSSFLDKKFNIFCCMPSQNPEETLRKFDPDICFFDREVVKNSDIEVLREVQQFKKSTYIILAYFYYDANLIPEDDITSMVNDVILKPYQFDKLIDKINNLAC